MSTMESHIEKNVSKLEAQLKLWNAKLGEVVAKANVAGQQAKIDSRAQVEELKAKLERAQSKLDEAKAAGSEKWDALKQGVEHIWDDLEDAFKKLVH
jgi:multidrug efflux pump subunit AcrA (membrane-fusion protein)